MIFFFFSKNIDPFKEMEKMHRRFEEIMGNTRKMFNNSWKGCTEVFRQNHKINKPLRKIYFKDLIFVEYNQPALQYHLYCIEVLPMIYYYNQSQFQL